MSRIHDGVLIPQHMSGATEEELDEYVRNAKADSRAFNQAYFELMDVAEELGIELES